MTKIYTEYEELEQELMSCLGISKDDKNAKNRVEYFLTSGAFYETNERLKFIKQDEPDDEWSGKCYTIIELDGIVYKLDYTYTSHWGYNMDYIGVTPNVKKKQMVVDYYD